MSDDLVAFLRARLDEDERIALAANAEGEGPWFIVGESPDGDDVDVYLDTSTRRASSLGGHTVTIGMTCGCCGRGAIAVPFARHIAHYDAARALREVEAKRRIIRMHEPRLPDVDGSDHCWICVQDPATAIDPEPWPCMTLRLLALPDADHPDYREEWRL